MHPYQEAHLFIAAVRILEHQKGSAPPVEEVCRLLGVSVESGLAVCRKLRGQGILELVEDPFSTRLVIGDHLAIEKLPRVQKEEAGLNREIEQFMAKKKNLDKKVEDLQAAMKKKREDLFKDIELKMKKKMEEIDKK